MLASRSLLSLASDERLAREIRRGSEAAFEVIYGRHAAGMLALCRHILGSRDEAEEALQQTFAAVWSDLRRPDRPVPEVLKPWLYAVARHRCLSVLRSRRPKTLELDEIASTSGVLDEVGRRAELRALVADLHDLPEEQRTALVLSELAGLSHVDIGDVLGREASGVKSLVFQARNTLGDWREAREAPCAEIREQLSVLHGGALRRRALRRHLHACASCREFRAELQAQRRRLAIVLPVLPPLGLKHSVLGAIGLGAASGGGAAGGGAVAGGAVVGLGVPALVPLGSATVATVAVIAVLAGGGPSGRENQRERDRPAPLARATAASPEAERPSQRARARPANRPPPLGRIRPLRRTRRAEVTHPHSQPSERRQSAAPAPNAVGAPGPAESESPHSATARTTAADREAAAKIAKAELAATAKIDKANREAAEKTAKADQEEAEKTAKADQEEAKKIAEADKKAAGKGPAEQLKAEEAKAKARQEADAKRAKAREEAAQKRAQALREAEEKKAKALEELAEQKARALAEAAKKNAEAARQAPDE